MSVTCPYCGQCFPHSDNINSRHKTFCPGWQAELGDTKPRPCLCGHEATSLTQMKRHRAQCEVWKTRHRGTVQMARLAETLQTKHGEGATHPAHIPEAEARRKATLKERYGAENVFCRESSIFDKVQASLDGKRPVLKGEDNPFSRPEVQDKIRQTHLDRLGVENPSQNPGVRNRAKATNLERYGTEETLAAPVIRARIAETNQERYGGPAPFCSSEIMEKVRRTNLENWGVEWTAQHPVVRQKQLDAMIEHYGSHFFASDEGKKQLRETFIREYGVPHPMLVPEIAFKALVRAGGQRKMNLLERQFAHLHPEFLYTGNGAFWRWLPKLGHHKNPDFILPGSDPEHPKKGVTKVVELFGDFWHSRMFTGSSNFEHEQQLVDAFADIGVKCLVIWESTFKADPEATRARVLTFLSDC